MNTPTDAAGLRMTVHRVSNEAFKLAQQFAASPSDLDQQQASAREINRQLDDLWPLIKLADANEQADLSQAWSDARLDVDYVLSGGGLSTSTRLYYYLQGLKAKK